MRQIAETLALGYSNEYHEGHWEKKKKKNNLAKASGQHLRVHTYTTEKIIIWRP